MTSWRSAKTQWMVAGALSASAIGAAATIAAFGQGVSMDRRLPPATMEQLQEAARAKADGRPVAIVTPSIPAVVDEPTDFGPYRLIPFGSVGEIPQESLGGAVGVRSDDVEVLRRSPLFREVPRDLLPPGLRLISADTGADDSESTIHTVYADTNSERRIVVWRMAPRVRPIHVDLLNSERGFNRTAVLDGAHVIVQANRVPDFPGRAIGGREYGTLRVRMGANGLDVLVESPDYNEETLVAIAKALVK